MLSKADRTPTASSAQSGAFSADYGATGGVANAPVEVPPGMIPAVKLGVVLFLIWLVCNSVTVSIPVVYWDFGLHCRPSAGNLSSDFSFSYVQVAATGFEPVTHGL
jgi:hypothetical protein